MLVMIPFTIVIVFAQIVYVPVNPVDRNDDIEFVESQVPAIVALKPVIFAVVRVGAVGG